MSLRRKEEKQRLIDQTGRRKNFKNHCNNNNNNNNNNKQQGKEMAWNIKRASDDAACFSLPSEECEGELKTYS